jgi:hypothetical protein
LLPAVVFDRTPLDYLAYLAASGADLPGQASAAALRPAFASLDLLVITLITPETERVLPAAEMPGLRAAMNDALLELVYDDTLDAWGDIPVLELSGPIDGRLDTVLAALNQPARSGVEFADQRAYPRADLIPDGPDLLDGEPGGVGQVPVQVPLARVDRTGVAAAHGDHDVGGLDSPAVQRLGELRRDVQADLGHGLHHGGVQLAGWLRARRGHPDPPGRLLAEQRGGHLGPARVVGAHEEHLGPAVHHARSLPGQPASRQAADPGPHPQGASRPDRLRLVSMVAAHEGREACVCELTEPLGLTQPTVSHHPPWSHRDDPPATS